ncbi:hypothetical protein [Xanthomonas phage Carpasina]|uniref:Cyanophage baseplate Pam3 plug gp18 domain-containing protein n=3 Tax=Carpasinavirus TaxID=2733099 RepID=A0A858NPW4_9CAUD|nr:virion structural protein [Xanthomonas phage Carpasina]AWD92413.1 hypothetical protein [Xanthomonas phage Carpasina]QJB22078.1 hypothetical protein XccvBFoX6_gp20 [Xanthomonas phage FoX6]QJB22177.1 hypothetical protein XccvBFoX7_gp20 [Xanthomonas phage FoX7]
MYKVELNPVPNQTVSFNLDGAFWQIHIFQSISFMCADISLNGRRVISGVRCFGGFGLMPYSYMTAPNFGNFVFDFDADWTGFGSTCSLYFLDAVEFKEFQSLMLSGE